MEYAYRITNMDATLMWGIHDDKSKSVPLLHFVFKGGRLESYEVLRLNEHMDYTLAKGINEKHLNMFLSTKVVEFGAQDYMEYVHEIGLNTYDFTDILKRTHMWNPSYYWLDIPEDKNPISEGNDRWQS